MGPRGQGPCAERGRRQLSQPGPVSASLRPHASPPAIRWSDGTLPVWLAGRRLAGMDWKCEELPPKCWWQAGGPKGAWARGDLQEK